jgi:sodium/potassium-transporting ATPase subunit alpha
LCSDKSGTLFQLSFVSRLCNGAKFEGNTNASIPQRTIKGDPTHTAVLRIAEKLLHKCLSLDNTADVLPILSDDYKKIFEISFNSRNMWIMSVIQDNTKSESWMLINGVPDALFPSATSILNAEGKPVPFDPAHQSRLSQLQHKWSSEGQRVIAVCKRSLDVLKLPKDETELEEMLYNELEDLTLVGLISIRDPPRADVKDAVKVIRAAGVRVFMVTGDFMITAVAIAKQVFNLHFFRFKLAAILINLFFQVGIITQDRYDTIHNLSRSESSGTGNEPAEKSQGKETKGKETKEMSITLSVPEAAAMKPTDDSDDPINITKKDQTFLGLSSDCNVYKPLGVGQYFL